MFNLIDIFKALSDKTRLRILSLLIDDELCVCEIESGLKLSQPNASKHLGILKTSKILENYKKAQWTYYQINNTFKTDHKDLWNYLVVELRKLNTYETDITEYKRCRNSNICFNKKIIEEEN